METKADREWDTWYNASEQRQEGGLVGCDDLDCPAKEAPETLEEYRVALDHWMNHSFLNGCSHGA